MQQDKMHKCSDNGRLVQYFKAEEWQNGLCLGGLWPEERRCGDGGWSKSLESVPSEILLDCDALELKNCSAELCISSGGSWVGFFLKSMVISQFLIISSVFCVLSSGLFVCTTPPAVLLLNATRTHHYLR